MEPTDSRSAITDEAARWWARVGMRDPRAVSRADREEFTRWVRASPVNVAELLRIAHVHFALEHVQDWTAIGVEEPSAGADKVVALRGPIRRRPRMRWWITAATAVAAGLMGILLLSVLSGHVVQTAQAERREVVLNDGSVVQLEPETRIEISFSAHERRVRLERGRAFFRVAKDATRPFWVRADGTRVRAVGTEFGVEDRERSVVVTVAEGKVAVLSTHDAAVPIPASPATKPGGRGADVPQRHDFEVFVAAGEQVTMPEDGAGAIPAVRTVDTSRALAWTQGRLVFENEPLAQVIAEFNEYNHLQLHLSDPALAARRISGVFDATDPQTLLAFIEAGSHVRIERESNQEVIIEPAP
jgi:transmembrane sensor